MDGGLRNSNLKVWLDASPDPVVLRLYRHDPSLSRKEVDLLHHVAGAVPVPDVIHSQPEGYEDWPPFAVLRFVEGISFLELRRRYDPEAVREAAWSAGMTLAAIGRFGFTVPGWIGPGLAVTHPLLEGEDPMPRFVDLCLQSPPAAARITPAMRDRVSACLWRFEHGSEDCRLVHGDFSRRNLLVRQVDGCWRVVAVLDWEFAVSGSPLADIGSFLRYDRTSQMVQASFCSGFQDAGGELEEDSMWQSRVMDLVALCEMLTRSDLPDDVAAEILGLIRETVEAVP